MWFPVRSRHYSSWECCDYQPNVSFPAGDEPGNFAFQPLVLSGPSFHFRLETISSFIAQRGLQIISIWGYLLIYFVCSIAIRHVAISCARSVRRQPLGNPVKCSNLVKCGNLDFFNLSSLYRCFLLLNSHIRRYRNWVHKKKLERLKIEVLALGIP